MCACRIADGVEAFRAVWHAASLRRWRRRRADTGNVGQFMVLERMGVCQCFEIEVADPQAAIPFGAVFIDSLHAFFQAIQAYFIYIPDQRIGGRG